MERKQAEYRPVFQSLSATDYGRGFDQGPSQCYLLNKGQRPAWGRERPAEEEKDHRRARGARRGRRQGEERVEREGRQREAGGER